MAYSAGDVILVPFPYRDRLAEKTRPAVVISSEKYNQGGDVIVAAITSHAARTSSDVQLRDWQASGLQRESTARMLLATLAAERVVLVIGQLSDFDRNHVASALQELLVDWPLQNADS